jgi:predicted ATPase
LTSFIGREWEIARVDTRLRAPEVRLVTLTGVGGIGKTRLALQIADRLRDAFPQGVWFVNLAPLSDPPLVIPTLAQVLGVREQHGTPLVETLRAALREQRLLVVLDNSFCDARQRRHNVSADARTRCWTTYALDDRRRF